ncbi:MAG: reverse transcriptase family protein [Thermodesulfobacteriota bacterium]
MSTAALKISYQVFRIPKRSGGTRSIEAPNAGLKRYQQERLRFLSKNIRVSPFAHAFQIYKNTATAAMPHVGKEWVACMDIKDFFPSVTERILLRYVRTKTRNRIYPPDLLHLVFDFDDGKGVRLPQGAPTSPFLANAALLSLDWYIARQAAASDCAYTRYADDLVFSGANKDDLAKIMTMAAGRLIGMGFKINRKKTRYMHRSRRQMVCGVVVNEKLNLPRRWRKNLRAEKYQKELAGHIPLTTKGRLAYEEMVRNNKKDTYSNIEIISAMAIEAKLRLTRQ